MDTSLGETAEAQARPFGECKDSGRDGGTGQGERKKRQRAVQIIVQDREQRRYEKGVRHEAVAGEKQRNGDCIVRRLGGNVRLARCTIRDGRHGLVTVDGARDLEGGRAEKAYVLAQRSIDRDQHLRAEQAVGARPAFSRIVDPVAQVVLRADPDAAKLER